MFYKKRGSSPIIVKTHKYSKCQYIEGLNEADKKLIKSEKRRKKNLDEIRKILIYISNVEKETSEIDRQDHKIELINNYPLSS